MEELVKRKGLRLSRYDYSARGAYFVTICTQDRKQILSDITLSSVGDGAHDVPHVQLTELGKTVELHLLASEKTSLLLRENGKSKKLD